MASIKSSQATNPFWVSPWVSLCLALPLIGTLALGVTPLGVAFYHAGDFLIPLVGGVGHYALDTVTMRTVHAEHVGNTRWQT